MVDFGESIRELESVSSATAIALREVADEIRPTVEARIRQLLLAKYDASGIKTKTGKLRAALASVSAMIIPSGKKKRITYWLPAGVPDYERGPNAKAPKGGFYEVFSALAYGSIRGLPGMKKKDKRGLKKIALRKKDGIVRNVSYRSGMATTSDEAGNVVRSSVVVTAPKDFWPLSKSEEREIKDLAAREIEAALMRRA